MISDTRSWFAPYGDGHMVQKQCYHHRTVAITRIVRGNPK